MAYKYIYIGAMSALVALPIAAHADEVPASAGTSSDGYYSVLKDFSQRQDFAGINHFYFIQPQMRTEGEADFSSEVPLTDTEGGSAGGYVSFGSPPTSSFLNGSGDENDETWIDGVAFGVGWRPDVSGAENQGFRRSGRSFSGSEIDRVGLRADLTALLYDETANDPGASAWRVTGMLGSTSLSLLSNTDTLGLESPTGGGLLWDIGIGWSSGAMSVNAGYQSAYSLDEASNGESSIAVLSLGADYAILPGLSVYGELNVIDGPPDDYSEGLGTVVIVGTGVSF